jgi:hypothetical protein
MTFFYTTKEADYLKDRQDGTTIDLYVCSDGIMRTAYERSKFENYNAPAVMKKQT